jgi:hypothetical protein
MNGRNLHAVRVSERNIEEILMSTSAVSSSSLYDQLQSFFQTRTSDVQQLGQALSSGNLSAAQTAFSNLTTLGQSGPFANGDTFRNSQREQDFNAIGQALQNNDLAGAQSAFQSLLETSQGAGAGATGGTEQGANNGAANTATGPEIILNLSGATNGSGSTPEQITINVGAASSSGTEQVSLSVGPQGSTNPTEFQFNLNPDSNEQIVLNLLGVGSGSGTTTTSSNSGLSVSA